MGYYSEMHIGELITKFSPEQLERMYQELENAVKRGDGKAIKKIIGAKKSIKEFLEIKRVGPMMFEGNYDEDEGRYRILVNHDYPYINYANTDLIACFLAAVLDDDYLSMEFVGEGSDRWGYVIRPGSVHQIIYDTYEDEKPIYETEVLEPTNDNK